MKGYVEGEKNELCSDTNLTPIEDIATCSDAAKYVGKTYKGTELSANWTSGCYSVKGYVYLNKRNSSERNINASPISLSGTYFVLLYFHYS